ncbi:MAG: hypothetical protein QM582_04200 [Micropruina sp.]|uniref:hypothetical protein n=1 Tax=Micropruina sp. TaxID=2737536 RepID=UPI0039E65813
MPARIRFFQDELTIDAGLPTTLQAVGGDTLMLAGRLVTLTGLVSTPPGTTRPCLISSALPSTGGQN